MAMIGLKVPAEVGRLLNTIEVPGEHVSGDSYHITIANLGDDLPIEVVAKAIQAVYEVAAKTLPFSVSFTHVSSFPKNPAGVPVICLIKSPELVDLHGRIKKALDEFGVEYSKKFPDFKPHVTLAYNEDEMDDIAFQSPLEWSAYEMTLWGGDSGENQVVANFPFSLPTSKVGLWRRVIRASMLCR